MCMRIVVCLSLILAIQPAAARADDRIGSAPSILPKANTNRDKAREALDDVAIIALIIAGSVALYKATGHPCACPSDLMRNGKPCGGRSAWSRAGGARPLCFPKDVTPEMISAFRATKTIPPVW